MNKTLLFAGLIASLGLLGTAARADGTITFTGKVVANTCTFNVNGGGVGGSGTVVLPVVFTSALTAAAAVAGTTPFNIVVSGCDSNLTSVQEQFSGTNVDAATGNLKNTGSATLVQVQLLNGSSNAAINLSTNANSPVGTLSGGAVTLSYKAQYYATGASTSGLVNTSVTYTTTYL